jgi:hypothetical protein
VQKNLKEKLNKLASEKRNIEKEINHLEPGQEEVICDLVTCHVPCVTYTSITNIIFLVGEPSS